MYVEMNGEAIESFYILYLLSYQQPDFKSAASSTLSHLSLADSGFVGTVMAGKSCPAYLTHTKTQKVEEFTKAPLRFRERVG
jgi:hypothetical protein